MDDAYLFPLDRDDACGPEFPQSRGGGLAIDTEMFDVLVRWPVLACSETQRERFSER